MFKVLTVAGSDSGGGAGVQADLKTFCAFGVYGLSVITAVTAQNTVGVQSSLAVPAEVVGAQISSVLEDIGADAVKTGMLANEEIVFEVAERFTFYEVSNLVVDPVMVSKSGSLLLSAAGVDALASRLLPLARVATPNIPEAEALTGLTISSLSDMKKAALEFLKMGPDVVIIKGGHALFDSGNCMDVVCDRGNFVGVLGPRIQSVNGHGTGCTFSAAIAAMLSMGNDVLESVRAAKAYVLAALKGAETIGKGKGPVNHLVSTKERQAALRAVKLLTI